MLPARAVFSAKFKSKGKNRSARSLRAARPSDGRTEKLQFYAFFIFIFLSRVYMHALLDIRGDWVYNNSRLFCRRAEDGAPPGAKYIRSARERNVL